jgi:glycosyltransferase involved in cell wall biosynthesis
MDKNAVIVFTFPDVMGGVSSFNYNVINFSRLKNNCKIKVILIREIEDNRPLFYDKFEGIETIRFQYSKFDNLYFVCKRLNKLIGNEPGALVCDNRITLLTTQLFSVEKTVFHLIHDFFYVKQNIYFGSTIDVSIAHSSFFADCIFASDPESFNNRSLYIPYGVKQLESFPQKALNENLKLLFLGRLEKSKGVHLLNEIDDKLKSKGINVDWLIIGKGSLEEFLKNQWNGKTNVEFRAAKTNNEIYDWIVKQDVFVFPTTFEGTPVSILECISNGIVPLVSNLPGGIRDIVTKEIGFTLPVDDTNAFVAEILKLNADRQLLQSMQMSSWKKAVANYNIALNADNYFEVFFDYERFKRKTRQYPRPQLSRLDKSYVPNLIVKSIRRFL